MLQCWARPSSVPFSVAAPWRRRQQAPALASRPALCQAAAAAEGPATAGGSGDGGDNKLPVQVPASGTSKSKRTRAPSSNPYGAYFFSEEREGFVDFVNERCIIRPYIAQTFADFQKAYEEFLEERQQGHLAVNRKRLWPLLRIVTDEAGVGQLRKTQRGSALLYVGITAVSKESLEENRKFMGLAKGEPKREKICL